MAIGTVTAGTRYTVPNNILELVKVTFVGDTSYPAGGLATFSQLTGIYNALRGKALQGIVQVGACGGYIVWYDHANDKLLIYEANSDAADGPLQATTTSNLSGVTFELLLLAV